MRPVGFSRSAVLPRSAFQILRDWHRSTGASRRRTSGGRASTWVRCRAEGGGKGKRGGLGCRAVTVPHAHVRRRTEELRCMPFGAARPSGGPVVFTWRTACSASDLLPVHSTVPRHHAPRTLAVKWLRPTRLETRTKESNMCASLRVTETRRRNESESTSVPR